MACRSAHYGQGKKLRDESWKSIGDDILRRLNCGDLRDEVQTLSFKGRPMRGQGWRMLEQVLPKLTTCYVLDLSGCSISDVTPLIEMMPKLIRMCKCFDLGGNNLSSKSVALLVEAMRKYFLHVRPTWLVIGDDACASTRQYLHDPLACNPYYKRGCMHAQHSVVHVVKKLPDFRHRKTFVTESVDVRLVSKAEWPKLVPEQETTTPSDEATDSDDTIVTKPPESMDICAAFRLYVKAQHFATKLDMLHLWSSLGGCIAAPLSFAAQVAQNRAYASFETVRSSFGDGLTSILIGENMYILAAIGGRLTFINLSESVQVGGLVDFYGRDACDAVPVQNFQYTVEADAHEAEQHELHTVGSERLSISLQVTDYLLSGWVVCDGLWFPMRKCKII